MSITNNTHLKVPFSEKDQAKSLGAKWNAELKLWYVPPGLDATPFAKWISDSGSEVANTQSSPVVNKNKSEKPRSNITQDGDTADDNVDAINARLRDAFESRDVD